MITEATSKGGAVMVTYLPHTCKHHHGHIRAREQDLSGKLPPRVEEGEGLGKSGI